MTKQHEWRKATIGLLCGSLVVLGCARTLAAQTDPSWTEPFSPFRIAGNLWDHDAGSALIKRLTGAKYMVMDADVPVVESGGKADFEYGSRPGALYEATHVNRVLHDGDVNPGYKLVNNTGYPRIAEDYEQTFRVLRSLPCDYFLGAHATSTWKPKYARLKEGARSPFIDPEGYKKYVAQKEQEFRAESAKHNRAAEGRVFPP